MSELVTYHVEEGIGHLRLTRGAQGNAVDLATVEALLERTQEARTSGAKVVLLSAEGRFFSVGGDLASFLAADDSEGMVEQVAGTVHRAISQLVRLNAVVVVALHGPAAGVGVSLTLAGDLVVAGESSVLTLGYTKVGLSPDGGSTALLPQVLGLHRAMQVTLLNAPLTAEEGLARGIYSEVVPDAEVHDRALALCRKLADGPIDAFIASRNLLRRGALAGLETQMELEARSISQLAGSPSGQEGMSAFLEKRKPNYPR